jgi:membrane protein required for colicin V production
MTWVDYGIVAIVLISLIVGLLRGFVREIFSLGSWILAFWLAWRYGPWLAGMLAQHISAPAIRLGLGYCGMFVLGLVLGAFVSLAVVNMIDSTPLAGPDSALGAGLGLLRGGFIVVALVMLAQPAAGAEPTWWRQSMLIPYFRPSADELRGLLPAKWRQEVMPNKSTSPSLPSSPVPGSSLSRSKGAA